MRYLTTLTVAALVLGLFLTTGAYGYWQEYEGSGYRSSDTRERTTMETGFKTSWLFGRTVWNTDNQDIGSITELVVAENGRAKYAILNQGGTTGRGLLGRSVGDELYAVPWSAVAMDTKERTLTVDITMEKLREAPTFKKSKWESFENPTFEKTVHGYYGVEKGFEPELRERSAIHGSYKASIFMGKVVKNLQGEELGRIHDMIAGTEGRIKYIIVSQGGGLFGIGSKRFPVPWSAMKFDTDQSSVVLEMDKGMFSDAPNVAGSNWRIFDDPEWETKVHEYYGAKVIY
jgi:sporulation protein YlmC with PRC-barrel domain